MSIHVIFFFNDTATTEIYTLSLHDALPICDRSPAAGVGQGAPARAGPRAPGSRRPRPDDGRSLPAASLGRPATARRRGQIGRAHVLNSSHANISYAVFCLKKKITVCSLDRK